MLKANVNDDGHVSLTFIPSNLKDILRSDGNESISLFVADVMSELTAVVSGLKMFLEDNIGISIATMFKDIVCKHPESLFGEMQKIKDETEKMREEIRNADFD